MSCNMTENRSINQILGFIAYDQCPAGENIKRELDSKQALYECGPYDPEKGRGDAWAELGYEMHLLNRAALQRRYGARAEEMMGEPYEFHMLSSPGKFQAHKSVAYFLYQCAESKEIINSDLYKRLEQLKHSIAWEIVRGLELWDKAEWR